MICGGNEHFNRWLGAFKPEETRFGAKPGSLKARLATFLVWPCVGFVWPRHHNGKMENNEREKEEGRDLARTRIRGYVGEIRCLETELKSSSVLGRGIKRRNKGRSAPLLLLIKLNLKRIHLRCPFVDLWEKGVSLWRLRYHPLVRDVSIENWVKGWNLSLLDYWR